MPEWAKVVAGCLALIIGASAPSLILFALKPPFPGSWESRYERNPAAQHEHRNGKAAQQDGQQSPTGIPIQQPPDQNAIGPQTERQSEGNSGAEWWVAFWTFSLFIATTGLWFFTGLMWLATRRAVNEGQDAIAAARETAKAVAAQVEVMERAIKINLASAEYADSRTKQINRAYLSVRPIGVTPVDAPTACTLVDLDIDNHGNTPGFLSILHIECAETEPTGSAAYQALLDTTDIAVGPGKTIRRRRELDIYFVDDQTYYVFGFIEYSDIYGDGPHYTRFCYRAEPNKFSIAGSADWRWWN